ncbi:hypothetical protein CERSUDRAFT_118170 [Gelatoporia subvermispora B]|uniref:Uncharacterized protein n=1 Tax=Ceriporiopsis subvermispora (strain B) TaxID=914234 RepID=M2PBW6_CERS8|nr:hypothetical protein CERSUDRAFT_118170 [Gelatoporia subvermispora B]
MSSPTSVWEFLTDPAFKGVLPGLTRQYLDTGPVGTTRSKTMRDWLARNCKSLNLTEVEWNWQRAGEFGFFQDAMKTIEWDAVKDTVWPLQEIPYARARNEADITVAVEKHILYPVWRLLTSRDNVKDVKVDVTPEFRESALREYALKTSNLSEAYAAGDTARTGVRVDKIFSLELTYDMTRVVGPRLRSHGDVKDTTQNSGTGIKSVSTFLPFEELWGCLDPDFEENEEDFDVHKLKGLVCVELKRMGLISKTSMMGIAGQSLHEARKALDSEAKKMHTICQQTVRYAYHYGVHYALITDYVNSIILRLPGQDIVSLEGELQWAYISEAQNPRLPLAFVLWTTEKEVEELVHEVEERWKTKRLNQAKERAQKERGYGAITQPMSKLSLK